MHESLPSSLEFQPRRGINAHTSFGKLTSLSIAAIGAFALVAKPAAAEGDEADGHQDSPPDHQESPINGDPHISLELASWANVRTRGPKREQAVTGEGTFDIEKPIFHNTPLGSFALGMKGSGSLANPVGKHEKGEFNHLSREWWAAQGFIEWEGDFTNFEAYIQAALGARREQWILENAHTMTAVTTSAGLRIPLRDENGKHGSTFVIDGTEWESHDHFSYQHEARVMAGIEVEREKTRGRILTAYGLLGVVEGKWEEVKGKTKEGEPFKFTEKGFMGGLRIAEQWGAHLETGIEAKTGMLSIEEVLGNAKAKAFRVLQSELYIDARFSF